MLPLLPPLAPILSPFLLYQCLNRPASLWLHPHCRGLLAGPVLPPPDQTPSPPAGTPTPHSAPAAAVRTRIPLLPRPRLPPSPPDARPPGADDCGGDCRLSAHHRQPVGKDVDTGEYIQALPLPIGDVNSSENIPSPSPQGICCSPCPAHHRRPMVQHFIGMSEETLPPLAVHDASIITPLLHTHLLHPSEQWPQGSTKEAAHKAGDLSEGRGGEGRGGGY